MVPVASAWLVLSSNDVLDPTLITSRIGIEPTDSAIKGETRVSPSGHIYPQPWAASFWRRQIGPERTRDLNGLLERLLDPIRTKASTLVGAARDLNLSIEVSLHIKMADETPGGTIESHIVDLISEIGATLDLDLYVVDPDDDQPWIADMADGKADS